MRFCHVPRCPPAACAGNAYDGFHGPRARPNAALLSSCRSNRQSRSVPEYGPCAFNFTTEVPRLPFVAPLVSQPPYPSDPSLHTPATPAYRTPLLWHMFACPHLPRVAATSPQPAAHHICASPRHRARCTSPSAPTSSPVRKSAWPRIRTAAPDLDERATTPTAPTIRVIPDVALLCILIFVCARGWRARRFPLAPYVPMARDCMKGVLLPLFDDHCDFERQKLDRRDSGVAAAG
ncbi:hypothetical protein C8R47DRAFT_337154 [Mycena vitilis]|nr:hypothetical protein C8R47DRAFT_337154 [Mycena vitilis]